MKKRDIIDQHIICAEKVDQTKLLVNSRISQEGGEFAERLSDAAARMHDLLTNSNNNLNLYSFRKLAEVKEPDCFLSFLNHVENVGGRTECISFMINQKSEVFVYKRLDTIATMTRVYYAFEDEKLYIAIPGMIE